MTFTILAMICVVLPIVAVIVEWVVDVRLSERHHSKHDTYVISSALTGALAMAMLFMGILGLILSWLCHVGVFRADVTNMLGFFASFVVVMSVMWLALRRYRVATYEDHLEVTPFLGRKRSVRYQDIERMSWSRSWLPSSNRSLLVMAKGEVAAVLIGTFDIDQILLSINRNDVLDTDGPSA